MVSWWSGEHARLTLKHSGVPDSGPDPEDDLPVLEPLTLPEPVSTVVSDEEE